MGASPGRGAGRHAADSDGAAPYRREPAATAGADDGRRTVGDVGDRDRGQPPVGSRGVADGDRRMPGRGFVRSALH